MSERLLEVRGLTVRFPVRGAGLLGPRGWLVAVNGVDLDVAAGQAVGIVGESGCGKSTLARAILGLVTPQSGTITWRGRPVTRTDAAGLRQMRREVQVVFQDPVGSLDPRMTIGESVAEALRCAGWPGRARRGVAAGRRLAGGSRPRCRARRALSARTERRAVPARRDRTRHRRSSEVAGV